jgi:phosphoribosyl 1,2-cyclic phosphate phosphodiesterase
VLPRAIFWETKQLRNSSKPLIWAKFQDIAMSLTFTILGCGSSMGVPRVALGWGNCDPKNPKNWRQRCSLLVERSSPQGYKTRVLIDCSPDLRAQLLNAAVDWIDGVLITHEHADHTHGIDDLRPLFVRKRQRVPIYMDEATSCALHARFGYCFMTPPGSEYPPIVDEHRLVPGKAITIEGQGGPVEALPILQEHGCIPSLGFRIGNVAYSADIKGLPPASVAQMAGLEVWIVDALRKTPHPSHLNLEEALAWIERIKPKRAILTNLHSDLDYEVLRAQLPPHVEPAYDQMKFDTP